MEFTIPEHQQRFEGIQKLKFGQSHFIDWDALGEIGQADDVRELVIIGEWDQLLSISDPIRRDITLELLASFSFDRSHADFDKDDTIQFWALGQYHGMFLTQFSMMLSLYYRDYVRMEEYA